MSHIVKRRQLIHQRKLNKIQINKGVQFWQQITLPYNFHIVAIINNFTQYYTNTLPALTDLWAANLLAWRKTCLRAYGISVNCVT